MASNLQKCPACGAMSGGKFCSECGTPLGPATCRSCGAKLSGRAKFCAECGTPVAGAAAAPVRGAVPLPRSATADRMAWYVAGVAVLALLIVLVVVVTRKNAPPAAAASDAAAAGATPDGPARATTDLSTMTPRQAAEMLFYKIMMLHQAGQNDSVNFFAPMALQAYANLGPDLDASARLDVGLVELATGASEPAAAQGDTILRKTPTHLFGFLLQADAAEAEGNTAAARRAYQGFLKNYAAEMAKQRPEYADRATLLQEARTKAERATGKAGA